MTRCRISCKALLLLLVPLAMTVRSAHASDPCELDCSNYGGSGFGCQRDKSNDPACTSCRHAKERNASSSREPAPPSTGPERLDGPFDDAGESDAGSADTSDDASTD